MLLLFAECSTAGGHCGRGHLNSGLYGDEYGFALHLSPHRLLCVADR